MLRKNIQILAPALKAQKSLVLGTTSKYLIGTENGDRADDMV